MHLTLDLGGQARFGPDVEWLEREIWSHVPPEERGQPHDSARDYAIFGYGPS